MHVGYTNPVLIMRLVSMAVWATHGATKVAATTATASVEMAFMGIMGIMGIIECSGLQVSGVGNSPNNTRPRAGRIADFLGCSENEHPQEESVHEA